MCDRQYFPRVTGDARPQLEVPLRTPTPHQYCGCKLGAPFPLPLAAESSLSLLSPSSPQQSSDIGLLNHARNWVTAGIAHGITRFITGLLIAHFASSSP